MGGTKVESGWLRKKSVRTPVTCELNKKRMMEKGSLMSLPLYWQRSVAEVVVLGKKKDGKNSRERRTCSHGGWAVLEEEVVGGRWVSNPHLCKYYVRCECGRQQTGRQAVQGRRRKGGAKLTWARDFITEYEKVKEE